MSSWSLPRSPNSKRVWLASGRLQLQLGGDRLDQLTRLQHAPTVGGLRMQLCGFFPKPDRKLGARQLKKLPERLDPQHVQLVAQIGPDRECAQRNTAGESRFGVKIRDDPRQAAPRRPGARGAHRSRASECIRSVAMKADHDRGVEPHPPKLGLRHRTPLLEASVQRCQASWIDEEHPGLVGGGFDPRRELAQPLVQHAYAGFDLGRLDHRRAEITCEAARGGEGHAREDPKPASMGVGPQDDPLGAVVSNDDHG